jgi:two-component system, NtrC family, response regulator AtoC
MSRSSIENSQRSTTDEAEQQKADSAESIVREGDGNEEPIASLRSVRAQVEIKAIMAALKRTGWNRKQAATLLKISYRGLLYKIRQHNITAA